jgi:hypothetical protein
VQEKEVRVDVVHLHLAQYVSVTDRTKPNCYLYMMKGLIEMLNASEYYGVSERVEIAKGKYQIPIRWKDGWRKIIRETWLRKGSK